MSDQSIGPGAVAILFAGLATFASANTAILVLVATGQVEFLAEAPSFHHLVMYTVICVALLVLCRRNPSGSAPSYRTPGYPVVPTVGALATFGLIASVRPTSLTVTAVLMALSYLWYRYDASGVEPKGAL